MSELKSKLRQLIEEFPYDEINIYKRQEELQIRRASEFFITDYFKQVEIAYPVSKYPTSKRGSIYDVHSKKTEPSKTKDDDTPKPYPMHEKKKYNQGVDKISERLDEYNESSSSSSGDSEKKRSSGKNKEADKRQVSSGKWDNTKPMPYPMHEKKFKETRGLNSSSSSSSSSESERIVSSHDGKSKKRGLNSSSSSSSSSESEKIVSRHDEKGRKRDANSGKWDNIKPKPYPMLKKKGEVIADLSRSDSSESGGKGSSENYNESKKREANSGKWDNTKPVPYPMHENKTGEFSRSSSSDSNQGGSKGKNKKTIKIKQNEFEKSHRLGNAKEYEKIKEFKEIEGNNKSGSSSSSSSSSDEIIENNQDGRKIGKGDSFNPVPYPIYKKKGEKNKENFDSSSKSSSSDSEESFKELEESKMKLKAEKGIIDHSSGIKIELSKEKQEKIRSSSSDSSSSSIEKISGNEPNLIESIATTNNKAKNQGIILSEYNTVIKLPKSEHPSNTSRNEVFADTLVLNSVVNVESISSKSSRSSSSEKSSKDLKESAIYDPYSSNNSKSQNINLKSPHDQFELEPHLYDESNTSISLARYQSILKKKKEKISSSRSSSSSSNSLKDSLPSIKISNEVNPEVKHHKKSKSSSSSDSSEKKVLVTVNTDHVHNLITSSSKESSHKESSHSTKNSEPSSELAEKKNQDSHYTPPSFAISNEPSKSKPEEQSGCCSNCLLL